MHPFETTREIPASPAEVFAAFQDSTRLARWWGPAGFTNTFAVCEFQPGGRWSFVMHGPEAGHYQNDSIFVEIDPEKRVVIQHESMPKYRLTITFSEVSGGTLVSWSQAFEDRDVARRVERIVVPANEQNLDRLAAEVLRSPAS